LPNGREIDQEPAQQFSAGLDRLAGISGAQRSIQDARQLGALNGGPAGVGGAGLQQAMSRNHAYDQVIGMNWMTVQPTTYTSMCKELVLLDLAKSDELD
jgi:hypothetical protein